MPRTSARNSSDSTEISGVSRPAAAKMSSTPSDATAREMIWRTARSNSSSGRASPAARFDSAARTAWKKPTSSRMRSASSRGTASANACDSSRTALRQRSFPSSCARMCSWAACSSPTRSAGLPAADIVRSKPWNSPQQTSYFSCISGHRVVLIQRRLPDAAALGVGGERPLQFVGEAQVVDHQPRRACPRKTPVDAGDGLHQAVPAHRLVDVHRVQAGRVEARQPHVPHQHDAQRVGGVTEAVRERFPTGLVADVRLPARRIRRRTGHHDLDGALAVIVVVPGGAQAHELAVEVDADATAHADHHRLALERLPALLEMGNDVRRDLPDALLRPDDRLQLRPPRLELLLALDLLALGHLVEVGVDARPLVFVEGQLGKAALVVDRHRGAVLHRALDVVDADVVAEDGAGAGVLPTRRACR